VRRCERAEPGLAQPPPWLRRQPRPPLSNNHLRRYEGRDYAEITKTAFHPFDLGERTGELNEELARLHGLGVDVVIGFFTGKPNPALLQIIGSDVIPVAENLQESRGVPALDETDRTPRPIGSARR